MCQRKLCLQGSSMDLCNEQVLPLSHPMKYWLIGIPMTIYIYLYCGLLIPTVNLVASWQRYNFHGSVVRFPGPGRCPLQLATTSTNNWEICPISLWLYIYIHKITVTIETIYLLNANLHPNSFYSYSHLHPNHLRAAWFSIKSVTVRLWINEWMDKYINRYLLIYIYNIYIYIYTHIIYIYIYITIL